MRVVVDARTRPQVARWVSALGHDVVSIYDEAPLLADVDILALAVREGRVVVTNDKDFGEMVYREQRQHCGVVLLRLANDRAAAKIAALERFLADTPNDMMGCFVVVTERSMRVARAAW